jgi:hypothetical protein
MKQVSKFTLFIAFFAITTVSFAQISFGVKAGLNLANVNFNGDGSDILEPKITPSFQIGGIVEFGLTESIALQSGISLQGKGFKIENELIGDITSAPMYLQVPVHVLYNGGMFFVGAGPFVGFGILGKVKSDGESTDLSFGSGVDDDYAPLEYGIGAQLGVNLGSIRVGAGYDLGLSDLTPKDAQTDGFSAKSGVINVFAAYMFGGGGGDK